MTYSVNVTNNSGAAQNVAIFLAITPDNTNFSLVWKLSMVINGGNKSFSWNETDFGLGWGTTEQPINAGALFTSGQQPPTPVYPNKSQGVNVLPVYYVSGSFIAGSPYTDNLPLGQLHITTDTSFTVSDALTMCVGVYMDQNPALVTPGAPNSIFYFDVSQLSYYLTVTNFSQGTALPISNTSLLMQAKSSTSKPARINFKPGSTALAYILDGSLNFNIC